ncbi:MAG: hypothetical protein ETSY2_49770 [Candidatus Entotheonella gemina]|uniref:Uncharacterized protein n=1 Tax=Candidatus Entotheonella gemina TaxID=1429439 RepID=W4LAW7_9BACT|nr:MAG: hypothetical protein ETSY2_49770 [Candidatus Entotheonella gemina]
MLAFNTLADAYNWFIKSDFRDFGWFPGFHEDQLVQFLYCHSNGVRSGEQLVMLFLQCHGQDVTQYFDAGTRQRAGCCMSCGMVLWQIGAGVPEADDDWRWWAIANEHAYDCEWAETRAHRVAAP